MGIDGNIACSILANDYPNKLLSFTFNFTYNTYLGDFIEGQVVDVGIVSESLKVNFTSQNHYHGVTFYCDQDGNISLKDYTLTPPTQAITMEDYLSLPVKIKKLKHLKKVEEYKKK